MDTPKKARHLYYDQQIPLEELMEPAHAQVVSAMFARRAPTLEDNFFLSGVIRLKGRGTSGEREAPRGTNAKEETSRVSWWIKITRLLTRSADVHWRP